MGRILVEDAADKLRRLLHRVPAAKGMYVRQWGKNLILGRKEPFGPNDALVDDDRLKLAFVARGAFRLSARLANGRYQATGFSGSIADLVEIMQGVLPHYLQAWGGHDVSSPPRTSGRRD
ncbi:MAG: hypothetical protein ACREID_06710 [Planctomycetota bacterium]